MKQFKVMAAVAVAGLVMAGCAKDGVNGGQDQNDGTTSVKIQISYDQDKTRAVGSAVTGQLSATAGHIFFADAAGNIDTHVGIGNGAGKVQVSLIDLNAGEAVITGVSSQATKCYIVMNDVNAKINTSGITGNFTGSTIDAAFATFEIPVSNLSDASAGVVNVPLYGKGDVNGPGGTTGGKSYDASVSVKINAMTSRVQIGKITADVYNYTSNSVAQTVTINEYKVEGIYINNYHPSYTFKNDGAAVVDGGKVAANYSTTGSTVYATGGSGEKLFDLPNTTTTTSVVEPTGGNYWVYNVFPGEVAHIVIKLTGIKYTDSANGTQKTIDDARFLTLAGFKYGTGHDDAGDDVTAFEPTNTYTLSNISFDFDDLTTVPYDETMNVLVEVEMMTWVDNPIEWKKSN